MKIMMVTNTYLPHVGGVARSVESFADEFRRGGHDVLIVAPEFDTTPDADAGVVRVPAMPNFNGSDFSVRIPVPFYLNETMAKFRPDIIHAHHPFLLGDTALRLAHAHQLPLVFTHHTRYEDYTHYVPGDSALMKNYVIHLATGYANLAAQVFAPSESIAALMQERGVTSPVAVVPTGVQLARFKNGDGQALRRRLGIPADAFVVGHVGRLAPEKNLDFLARAVRDFLVQDEHRHFLVAGAGESREQLRELFRAAGLAGRYHELGILTARDLTDAYAAMDVFAFASLTETQGMVLTEAMAVGLPAVAVDAPGAREVVRDRSNGRLLHEASVADFTAALGDIAGLPPAQLQAMQAAALATAERFSLAHTARTALDLYRQVREREYVCVDPDHADTLWATAMRRLATEWELFSISAGSAVDAVLDEAAAEPAA